MEGRHQLRRIQLPCTTRGHQTCFPVRCRRYSRGLLYPHCLTNLYVSTPAFKCWCSACRRPTWPKVGCTLTSPRWHVATRRRAAGSAARARGWCHFTSADALNGSTSSCKTADCVKRHSGQTEGEGAHAAYSLDAQSVNLRYKAGQAVPVLMPAQAESLVKLRCAGHAV